MAVHLVSMIDVKDFGAETLRIGDLDGDGAPDLLLVQSVYETREITCLTALSIRGEVLWQVGAPNSSNGRIYSDLPVQTYDWDADGCNEVLYVRQARYVEPVLTGGWARERARRYEGDATLLVLDGKSGKEKGRIALPAPADDCFLFADLTGRGRAEDLVVKDRYWNVWGVAHEGEVLWHWQGSTGHFPAVADVDGDGKEEVFLGFALLDHDGRVLFQSATGETHHGHADATYIVRLADGSWRLFFGNHGLHCLDACGRELWFKPLFEAQHVVVGRYCQDSEMQAAVVNRGYPRTPDGTPATLYLYDLEGREIWSRPQLPGGWATAIVDINWSGAGAPRTILAYARGAGAPVAVYDGNGEILDTMQMEYAPDRTAEDRLAGYYATRADVWGDSRDEVLLFGSRGLCIFANSRPVAIPTLYNSTLYPGM